MFWSSEASYFFRVQVVVIQQSEDYLDALSLEILRFFDVEMLDLNLDFA